MSDLKPVKLSNVQAATKAVHSRVDDVVAAKKANGSKAPSTIHGRDLNGYFSGRSIPDAERTAVMDSWGSVAGPSNHDVGVSAEAIKQKADVVAKQLKQAAAADGNADEVSPAEIQTLMKQYSDSQRGMFTDLLNHIPVFNDMHEMRVTMEVEQMRSIYRLAMTYGDEK